MTINQGNILKVVHATNCNLDQAKAALSNSNNWIDAYKYAKQLMGE